MEILKRTSSQSTDGEVSVSSTIALTATLAISGTVIPLAFPLACTTAERIEAIQKATESGEVRLVNSLDGSPVKADPKPFDKGKGP